MDSKSLAVASVLLMASVAGASEAPVPASEEDAAQEEAAAPPKLVIRGFGNIDYEWRDDGTPNSFSLGELDLFLTSELTEDVSVLAEVVLEPEGNQETIIDVERYQIKYAPSDLLNFALGRMHTALGFWNQTYHHGPWFQATASRPVVYSFEDHGGVLPIHEVGLKVLGAKALPGVDVEYDVSLTNGRGRTPTEITGLADLNSSKAVNLWLGLAPRGAPGLKLGGVARFDTIPKDPRVPARADSLEERILGGFATFQRGHAEVLAELIGVKHGEKRPGGRSFRTTGLYLQAAYTLGRFKPYYRFDSLDVADADPFYAPETDDVRKHTAGVRINPTTWAAFKLELGHTRPDPGESFSSLVVQVAFTF